MSVSAVNLTGVLSIYRSEMAAHAADNSAERGDPVITTALYFVVFGAAIGGANQSSERGQLRRVHHARPDDALASDAEHHQRINRHLFSQVYRLKSTSCSSAPISSFEAVCAYVGAAATKSVGIGLVILITAALLVPVLHRAPVLDDRLPRADRDRPQPPSGSSSASGPGTSSSWQVIPALVVTPLTFLGGAFYSIDMLPPFWRTVSLFNPVVYLISGFRWSFYGQGDVSVAASLGFTALFIAVCLAVLAWIFRTGWRLKP